MANDVYYVGANDEHGVDPPTPGKRTPVLPGLSRQIYENEVNRAVKNKFIEGCLRNGFSVYDVKPEKSDVSISARVTRVNRQKLTLLVTFGYNAFGAGLNFNSAAGITVFYSPQNSQATRSRQLAEEVYEALVGGTLQRGRGVQTLTDAGVLTNVDCPSILVESGFMTNLREAQLMLDPIYHVEVGEETVKGVCNYLGVPYIPREIEKYPIIRFGSRGNFVTLLQFILNEAGYAVAVDGIFGNGTRNAVVAFQQNNSLSPDGIVGASTWRTLLSLPPYPVLRRGDGGEWVMFLQRLLESYLFPVGGVDGVFGANTESAVKRFQESKGLVRDGIVGPKTWEALTAER